MPPHNGGKSHAALSIPEDGKAKSQGRMKRPSLPCASLFRHAPDDAALPQKTVLSPARLTKKRPSSWPDTVFCAGRAASVSTPPRPALPPANFTEKARKGRGRQHAVHPVPQQAAPPRKACAFPAPAEGQGKTRPRQRSRQPRPRQCEPGRADDATPSGPAPAKKTGEQPSATLKKSGPAPAAVRHRGASFVGSAQRLLFRHPAPRILFPRPGPVGKAPPPLRLRRSSRLRQGPSSETAAMPRTARAGADRPPLRTAFFSLHTSDAPISAGYGHCGGKAGEICPSPYRTMQGGSALCRS